MKLTYGDIHRQMRADVIENHEKYSGQRIARKVELIGAVYRLPQSLEVNRYAKLSLMLKSMFL